MTDALILTNQIKHILNKIQTYCNMFTSDIKHEKLIKGDRENSHEKQEINIDP